MLTNTEVQVREVWEQWHQLTLKRDTVGVSRLYAESARFESPDSLGLHGEGHRGHPGTQGRAEIAGFLQVSFAKLDKNVANWYRNDTILTNGQILLWEYPRQTPNGDQTDLVESMDLEDGLIVHHRVHWGWVGFKNVLTALGLSLP